MAYDLNADDHRRIELERDTPFTYKRTFRPVVVRERHDGWTGERQAAFLEALGACGCVVEACAAVGMSTAGAYRLKNRYDAVDFRLSWDAALDMAAGRVEDAVIGRAINGVAVPHYYQGEQIGEHRRYDERLALFILRYRMPLKYGRHLDRASVAGHPEEQAERFAVGLDMVRDDVSRGMIEDEAAEAAAAYLVRDTAAADSARAAAARAAAQAAAAAARAAAGDATDATIARETAEWAAGQAAAAAAADRQLAITRDRVAVTAAVIAARDGAPPASRTNHAGGDVSQPSQTSAATANQCGSPGGRGRRRRAARRAMRRAARRAAAP